RKWHHLPSVPREFCGRRRSLWWPWHNHGAHAQRDTALRRTSGRVARLGAVHDQVLDRLWPHAGERRSAAARRLCLRTSRGETMIMRPHVWWSVVVLFVSGVLGAAQVREHDPSWTAPANVIVKANPLAGRTDVVPGGRKVF